MKYKHIVRIKTHKMRVSSLNKASPLHSVPIDSGLEFVKFISQKCIQHQSEILLFHIIKSIKLESKTSLKIIPFQLPPFQCI